MGVPVGDPGTDVGFERLYGLVSATADLLLGEQAEPALGLVDPGGAGRGEVDVEPGVFCQPGSYCGGLVGAVVVADEMHVQEERISFAALRMTRREP